MIVYSYNEIAHSNNNEYSVTTCKKKTEIVLQIWSWAKKRVYSTWCHFTKLKAGKTNLCCIQDNIILGGK